jgi:hypothetical protein
MALKFRDHPLMIRRSGMKTWPPRWSSTGRDKKDWPVVKLERSNKRGCMTGWIPASFCSLSIMGFNILARCISTTSDFAMKSIESLNPTWVGQ